jgi:hypothetical protein
MTRRLRPLAGLLLLAALAAGCSHAPAGDGSHESARDQAVAFAECMRAHGVAAFPDPDASGSLTIDGVLNGSSLDASSPAWKRAIGACKDLEPPGFTGPGARTPEQQEHALEFARCMRAHGVADFPDPVDGEPLVDTRRIPSSAREGGMTILNAAMHACGDSAQAAIGAQP